MTRLLHEVTPRDLAPRDVIDDGCGERTVESVRHSAARTVVMWTDGSLTLFGPDTTLRRVVR